MPSHQLSRVAAALALLTFAAPLAAAELSWDSQWPRWRGPEATGVAPHGNPPTTWSESENVLFKVEIPGRGHASPVVWGNTLFLLTAVPTGDSATPGDDAGVTAATGRGVSPDQILSFEVLALDRETGDERWRRTALVSAPHEGTHTDGTWASGSAVTDGEVLIASFGSRGIFAYDLDGKLLWQTDLGDMETRRGFGEGSSPALHGDRVVVVWDHEGESFIVALDKATGEEVWRKSRPDEPTSWATPLVVEVDGKPQVVVSATGAVRGYDLATGEVLWRVGGMTTNTIPTPVEEDGLAYAMSGFRGNALRTIRLSEATKTGGDVSDTGAVVWTHDRDTPYVPSPLLYDGALYFLKHNQGILSSLDAGTGEVRFGPQRLEGINGVYASPVAAAGRVYVVGRAGTSLVLGDGPTFEVLATNFLDDGFEASPAIVGDTLYLRGRRHLYALRDGAGKPPVEAEEIEVNDVEIRIERKGSGD